MAAIDHNSPLLQQKSKANSVAMALLRIAIGCFFVVFGQYKVFGSEFVRSGFRGYISGAGLDSSLKQVIRASTLELFETDPEIEKSVATLFTKIDAKDIAVYLLKPSPRHAMIEDTIDDLTGSSLQSTFELERIIGFLHLDRQKIIGSAKQDIKEAFDTRNKIIHELDVSGETPAAGVHFRTRRNRDEMTKQANTILRVAFAFLAEVDKKLGH
jgi:hypothetical protein